jgi:hypothetical protein
MPNASFRQSLNLVAASLLGGYAFTWGFSALGVVGLVAIGVDFHEAETVMLLLAFLVFLAVFLWSFSISSLTRVWGMLAGGGATMMELAWWIQQLLLRGA